MSGLPTVDERNVRFADRSPLDTRRRDRDLERYHEFRPGEREELETRRPRRMREEGGRIPPELKDLELLVLQERDRGSAAP